jgi:hypothetical protein
MQKRFTSISEPGIEIVNGPVVVAGRRYAAHLDADTGRVRFDATAPLREIIEAAIDAGREIEREEGAE